MKSAYIRKYDGYGFVEFKPLRPTGRWKIESGPYYEDALFIEHQGLIFKSWVSSSDIEFRATECSEIFECSR